MKKILRSFLILVLAFMPILVYAEGETNGIEGTELTSPGAEFTLTLFVNSPSSSIKSYKGTLTYESDVLELISISNGDGWEGKNSIGKSPLDLEFNNSNGIVGKSTLASFKFKVKSDCTKSEAIFTLSGSIQVEDQWLQLGDAFAKTIAIKSTDNTLKELKVNGKPVVNFSPNTYSYSFQVEQETTTANIEAVTNSSTATFTEKYGPRSVGLDYGDNTIEVKVLSASGAEKTYVLNIHRLDNRGTNNNLKQIILNSGKVKIDFDKNTLSYKIKTYKLTSIEVVATPEDDKAQVKVEKDPNLQIGENTIKITVTSEDGKEKVYTIIIDNQNRDVDTTLKNLTIFGLDEEFEFDKNVTEYTIIYKAKYKNSVVFKPELNTPEDGVQVDEPLLDSTSKNLKEGSVVKIRVYAPDGTETMYNITFSADKRVNFFLLLSILIFLVLLIIFIKLIIDRKKNKNASSDDDENIEEETEEELLKTKRINKINLE